MTVRDIIDGIIEREGGYVNDPNDLGGATNYGITEKVAREWGYQGDMRDLPRIVAYQIYEQRYYRGQASIALPEYPKQSPKNWSTRASIWALRTLRDGSSRPSMFSTVRAATIPILPSTGESAPLPPKPFGRLSTNAAGRAKL